MIKFFEVRPNAELKPQQTDRYIELKTATLGYFEAQIFRHRDDGTHYDAADLFAVADAAEADMLLAALQQELPDVDFTIGERISESGMRFNPLLI